MICISYKKLGTRVEVKENQIMKNNIVIRLEEKSEYRKVENLVRDSFWNVYRPGCLEHYALKKILIFMERVDSGRQASMVSVIMDCQRGEDVSFFLCKELVPGYLDEITGEYATPEGYLVDEQDAEEFDK